MQINDTVIHDDVIINDVISNSTLSAPPYIKNLERTLVMMFGIFYTKCQLSCRLAFIPRKLVMTTLEYGRSIVYSKVLVTTDTHSKVACLTMIGVVGRVMLLNSSLMI